MKTEKLTIIAAFILLFIMGGVGWLQYYDVNKRISGYHKEVIEMERKMRMLEVERDHHFKFGIRYREHLEDCIELQVLNHSDAVRIGQIKKKIHYQKLKPNR